MGSCTRASARALSDRDFLYTKKMGMMLTRAMRAMNTANHVPIVEVISVGLAMYMGL